MKKILILGAGNAQIDAIKYCKNKGYEVYGCSYTNDDKGIPLLDHFRQIDIKDIEGIESYIQEKNIEYIYSVGSDLAMPTVAKVSEDLGLKHFISSRTADICQAKHKMRTELGQDFKGNIPFQVCRTIEEAKQYHAFPGMMKPVDSQGQRGCYRVDSVQDIEENFAKSLSYSKSGNVIIEKFIDGPEVSVNVFVENGEVKFALVSDRIVFENLPGGIIKEHLLPTHYPEAVEETKDLVKRVIEKLGITQGPAYMQIKLDNGSPMLLEVTPRLDGCHMWNLIKHYCGVDLLDASFSWLLEGKGVSFEMKEQERNLKLAFMCEEPGKAFDRTKYNCDGAEYSTWYYESGDVVKTLNGYMEKCGYQIREY